MNDGKEFVGAALPARQDSGRCRTCQAADADTSLRRGTEQVVES